MSNYYRYSSALGSSTSRRSSTPGWLWLFTGLLLGVGVAYYAYWQGKGTITPTVQAQTVGPLSMKPAPSAKDAPKTGDSAVTTKPAATAGIDADFDFYTILPEMQMAVPEPIVAPTPVTIAKVVTPVISTPLQLKPEANTKVAEPEQAKALVAFIRSAFDPAIERRHMLHVNMIPLNPTGAFRGRASQRETIQAFCDVLDHASIPNTVRMRRGIDISAGCGQLKARANKVRA